MKVMVTGATGFVGSHATAALMRAGHEVRLLVRRPDQVPRSFAPFGIVPTDLVVGDILDEAAVASALDGCDAVLHSAAIYSLNAADAEVMGNTNVAAAQVVLGAAVARKLDPILHISSTVALTRFGGTDSSLPLGDVTLPYSRSKVESEKVARAFQDQGAPVVTVYPGTVYGPDDPYNGEQTERVKWILRGALGAFPQGAAHAVDVREVAAVIAAAMEPGLGPRRLVVPGTHVDGDVLFAAVNAATGRRLRHLKLPTPVARTVVKTIAAVQPRIPGDWHYPADLEAVELSVRDTDFTGLFDETLGVRARPFVNTIADQIAWMARAGRIPERHAGVLAGR
ncbi:NAD-dependent epimerase/dehydratase family protein [Smaragdicoccus niigatensis]|uniref:NAD-dependent epimerase/dehydratase family protein n=1 Tax=Smaragdicoccus niigatensis TaxID=359359 RepID=UPI000367C000|nr:NAD-dependent epimerase/dehydratase family protein [Smaragdicoccus niigatensis]